MKHKLGLLGFSYLMGLVCAAFFKNGFVFVLSVILLAAGLVCHFRKKKIASVIMLTAFSATVISGIYTCFFYCPALSLEGENADIIGTVTEIRPYSNDTAAYIIKADINGIKAKITMFSSDVSCKIGDSLSFNGNLSVLKNNAGFEEESYYKSKGIFLKAYPRSSVRVTESKFVGIKALMTGFSDYIGEKISIALPGDEGDILKAMFLGDKSGLSDSLAANVKRAGISHFTAVSGIHLTLIAHILMMILAMTPLKNRRYFRFIVLSVLILLFTVFFKLSASVVRAGIMLIIYYGAEPFMRKGSTVNSMGAAILAITLFQPYACTDIGFLLSIAGTFGSGVVSPYFCKRVRKNRLYGLKCLLIGSLCATLCTFPLSSFFFGGISVIGILMNFLLYPLFFPALVCVTLFTLTFGMAAELLFPAGLLAKGMVCLINFFGNFKYAYIPLDYSYILYISVAAIIFIVITHFRFEESKRTAMAIGLSLCILTGSVTFSHFYSIDKIKLTMYSDGSDACVIVKKGANAYAVASGDSPKIELYIKEYMRNEFLGEMAAVSLLQSDSNNEKAFASIPCRCYSPPEEAGLVSSESGDITVDNKSGTGTFSINNFKISVSPAAEPLEADISVLYGYKKNIPQLSGRVFCSNRRINGENITNIYYENVSYYITKTGVLEKID